MTMRENTVFSSAAYAFLENCGLGDIFGTDCERVTMLAELIANDREPPRPGSNATVTLSDVMLAYSSYMARLASKEPLMAALKEVWGR